MTSQPFHLKVYFVFILLCLFTPVVSSFVTRHANSDTLATLRSAKTRPFAMPSPLFLHVEPIHSHRDSLVRLDDPLDIDKTATQHQNGVQAMKSEDTQLHRFTQHLAPMVLALYLIGHFLSNYHQGDAAIHDGSIDVNPAFGGSLLIGAGALMVKWSIEKAIMSL